MYVLIFKFLPLNFLVFNCHVPHLLQIQHQCAYNAFCYKLFRALFPLALAEGWSWEDGLLMVYLTPSLKIVLIKINISVRELLGAMSS